MFAAMVKLRMTASERIQLSSVLAVARINTLREDQLDLSDAVQAAEPTPELVAAAACAAALWRIDTNAVLAFLDRDPVAAARGLLDAQGHGAEWWDLVRIATHTDLDTLRAAHVESRIIEHVEHQREIDAMTPEEREELRRSVEAGFERRRREDEESEPRPLSLSELLGTPSTDSDVELNWHANELASQVDKLSADDLDALRRWLTGVWPTEPFADLITVEGNTYRLKFPASAWLFLAPAADVSVDDDQWAQLAATSSMELSEQAAWLRGQADATRMRRALDLMSDTAPSAWLHLLACCTTPSPAFVAEACLARVRAEPGKGYETRELASRLSQAGFGDAPRSWAVRDEVAATELRPMLAERDDIEAQRALVDGLLADARTGKSPSSDDVNWMAALRSAEFLPSLFEILEHLYPPIEDAPSIGGPLSALNPTLNAIQNIGTRDAVRLFDDLLARRDQRRWLRSYRDKIAADVLRATGDAAAPAAAAAASLPFMFGREQS